ncbi:SurA N-terminal domain-containing protein [Echinimonas agarilytica]|uniref:Periplasmic chaperone PpiD n=1 Tax=Echinimonas agarilytica TaxID=1215918 RepID=A0AA42B764_9GAMM|nr:SurA N-terminal domain-containing protein [Echinimonas agarilytica]MCM2679271.1 SurA N-terminal domain-containing protein [Echinimonas agarilytica]
MLERIREGSQGTVAKVILGAVILSFALAGVGSYLGQPAESNAAIVNGERISNQALEGAVRNERDRLKQQFGDNFDRVAANPAFMEQVRASVLDRLITEVLLDQLVIDSELTVGDDQVRQAIREIPSFQVDGQFSNDRYMAIINAQGYTAASFREFMRSDMSRRQLVTGVLDSEFVLPGELTREQSLLSQSRSIRYWTVDVEALSKDVIPTEEQVQAYYDANQFAFNQPEMVSVEFIELNAAKLSEKSSISDEDVEAYYNTNIELYRTSEERRASHILLANDEDGQATAKKIEAELAAGADFAALAEEYSADTFSSQKGGDLDWFARGVMGDEFDAAVFALEKEGAVSGEVVTPFGLHIIKLTGLRPSVAKPLSEVATEIKEDLIRNDGLEQYYQLQEEVTNLAFEIPDSLNELASQTGLVVQSSDLFSRNAAPTLLADDRVQAAIFSDEVLRDGLNSDPIEIGEGHLMVVRLKEHQPSHIKPLDEVRSDVALAVAAEVGTAEANVKADQMIATLKSGEQLIVDADAPVQVQTEADFSRNSVALNPAVRDRAFAMVKPAEGQSTYDKVVGRGFVSVIALDEVKTDTADVADSALEQRLQQQATQHAYVELVNTLRASAEIEYPKLVVEQQ